jgi:hypothetical protein
MHALLYPGTLTHALTSRKEVYPGGSGTGTLRRTKQEHIIALAIGAGPRLSILLGLESGRTLLSEMELVFHLQRNGVGRPISARGVASRVSPSSNRTSHVPFARCRTTSPA